MLSRALDVVFPPCCAGCGAPAWPFCERCTRGLRALAPPWCHRCGAPSLGGDVAGCGDCPPEEIAHARAPFAFEGPARASVHHLKYRGVRGVGRALGAAMATCAPPGADVVTWVPLARRRRAERGFDQARVLARGGGQGVRAAGSTAAAADRRDRPAGQAGRRGAPGGDARIVRRSAIARSCRATCSSSTMCSPPGRQRPRAPRCCSRTGHRGCRCSWPRGRSCARVDLPILDRALVRVCGCPGTTPGSRCQPRAKRPT